MKNYLFWNRTLKRFDAIRANNKKEAIDNFNSYHKNNCEYLVMCYVKNYKQSIRRIKNSRFRVFKGKYFQIPYLDYQTNIEDEIIGERKQ